MSFDDSEISVENAQPIELYIFSYGDINYYYTTTYYTQNITLGEESYIFYPEYIKRSDSLSQSSSSNSNENCIITVPRSNPVAMLFQGTPPEISSISVQIFRIHGEHSNEYTRILRGIVSQVKFTGSDAELTVTIEHILTREIPRGKLSYFCQNCIYDEKCTIDKENYKHLCYKENYGWGLTIKSSNLTENVEDGYYTNGYIQMGNSFRQIVKHSGDTILIKYPINLVDRKDEFYAYPGCDNLFSTCHLRFGNTENFTGIPYQQPYDAFRHPVDKGVYWVDGNIVFRDTNRTLYQMNL